MPNQVSSAFTFDNWDENLHDGWEDGKLSRTSAAKVFTGDMTGTGTLEAIMLRLGDDDGPMVYVAVERLDVEFEGRKGSFCLVHSATAHAGAHDKSLKIVPGSGTGDFAGIAGTAEILPGHDFVLDYELKP